MSFSGKGFTLEGLFSGLFTELWPSFPLSSFKFFSNFGGWTYKFFLLLNCYSLFHILRSKAAIGLTDLFLIFFSILLNILSLVIVCFGHKNMK